MSIVGKRLIVQGADWEDIAVGNLFIHASAASVAAGGTITLTAWCKSGFTPTTCTAISGTTSAFTVGARSGSGTEADKYTWTLTAAGTTGASSVITVTLDSGLTSQVVKTKTVSIS